MKKNYIKPVSKTVITEMVLNTMDATAPNEKIGYGGEDNEGLDLKLRVWNEIVNMINNNAKELCEVSSKENVLSLIDSISENSSKITSTFLQDSIKKMKSNIETTVTKINSISD